MKEFGRFDSTHFSVIQRACQGDPNDLDALFRQYVPPLRAHLVFRRNIPESESDDLLQSFFVKKMLDGKLLSSFDPRRGRFRTYLCSSLNNFCADLYRKKRIDAQELGEYDPPVDEPLDVFEVAYAREVLLHVLKDVHADCLQNNQERHWKVFEERYIQPVSIGTAPRPYAELAADYGFQSVLQTTNAVETVRRKFARTQQTVIANFEPDVDRKTELDALRTILGEARLELSQPLQNYLAEQSATDTSAIDQLSPFGLSDVMNRVERPEPGEYGSFEEELADVLNTPVSYGRDADDNSPTIGKLLDDVAPSLELLEMTKREFKRIGKLADALVSPQVATCIYLCCSFAALARLSSRITKLSDDELLAGIDWVESLPVPEDLRNLLRVTRKSLTTDSSTS